MAIQEKIQLLRLSYVHYEHVDFEQFRQFAKDFGFVEALVEKDEIYYRGYGRDPVVYIATRAPGGSPRAFKGAGFVAKTRCDFDKACQIPGAVVKDTSNRPGGGHLVIIPDPNNYSVEIVWGQEENPTPKTGTSLIVGEPEPYNGAIGKQRRGHVKRFHQGPAMIHKLGHFGYQTNKYEDTCDWYTRTFNFIPTDILTAPGNDALEIATFFRLTSGKEFVDHHCFLVTREGDSTKVHHASFEVEDFDTQVLGHYWLEEQGYKSLWGVGRHIYGSQLFDYWRDTSNFIVEHYADGDIVNDDTPTTRGAAGPAAIWGPATPSEFSAKPTA